MRKIILGFAVSLDGYIEGPKGEIDWCLMDQDYGMKDFLKGVDTLFMGRKTYELTQTMPGGAGFPRLKKYVFSRSLKYAPEGMILINGDLKNEVDKRRNTKGKDIWLFGGADLFTSLMNTMQVDEIWMMVHPVLLGGGKPLFRNIPGRANLKLLDSRTYSTGLVSVKYEVIKQV